jgi:hypothetical protein
MQRSAQCSAWRREKWDNFRLISPVISNSKLVAFIQNRGQAEDNDLSAVD